MPTSEFLSSTSEYERPRGYLQRVKSPRMGKVGEKPAIYSARPQIAAGLGERIGKVADVLGARKTVAAWIGVSVSALQRYIGGENMPPFDFCAQLCGMAKVRLEWLAFAEGPMYLPEAYAIPPRESQTARRNDAKVDSGLLHSAVRITEETLKKFGLRDQLDSVQKADLVQIVFNDLARGAADDAALASLGRILAINRKP